MYEAEKYRESGNVQCTEFAVQVPRDVKELSNGSPICTRNLAMYPGTADLGHVPLTRWQPQELSQGTRRAGSKDENLKSRRLELLRRQPDSEQDAARQMKR
eukprot:210750-Rhodomonas_salina.1